LAAPLATIVPSDPAQNCAFDKEIEGVVVTVTHLTAVPAQLKPFFPIRV
jgi:hypothetical protein